MTKKSRKSTSNVFLVNQACTDLINVIPSLLHSVALLYWFVERFYDSAVWSTYYVISYSSSFLSIAAIVLTIAHGTYMVKFGGTLTNNISKKAVSALISTWIMSCVYGVLVKVLVLDSHYELNSEYYLMASFAGMILLVVFLLTLMLALSWRYRQTRYSCRMSGRSVSVQPYEEMTNGSSGGGRERRRLWNSMFFRTSLMVMTHIPSTAILLIWIHGDVLNELRYHIEALASVSHLIYSFHPMLNSLITIFCSSDFHMAKRWITFGKCATAVHNESDMDDEDDVISRS